MNFAKKYSLMMLLLTGAMTIVSCSSNEEEFNAEKGNKISIIASNPSYESATRTLLDENEKPLWSGEDIIKVYGNAYTNEAYDFISDGRYNAQKASFSLKDQQIDRWIAEFADPQTEFYTLVHGPREMRYEKSTNEVVIRHGISEEPTVEDFENAQGPKQQKLLLGNISSASDILVGEKLIKSEMSNTSAAFEVRFKRLTSIMKINLVDMTSDQTLKNNGYKAVDGWISTGLDPYGNVNEALYKNNNFGGIARIAMTGDNAYKMTKERCTGLQLRPDINMDAEYFYDFNGKGNDNKIYISVLPTKLNANDTFTFVLGNGAKKIIVKQITLNKPMELKACHIHEITFEIHDDDIRTENPFM